MLLDSSYSIISEIGWTSEPGGVNGNLGGGGGLSPVRRVSFGGCSGFGELGTFVFAGAGAGLDRGGGLL